MSEFFQNIKLVATMGALVFFLVWESLAPCYAFFQSSPKKRAFHGLKNIILTALNALLVKLIFVGLWLSTADWADKHGIGLLNIVELPLWFNTLIAVLLLDIWTYWWHRISHIIPMLWRFHRVHHSDPEMDVTTANRFHFGEIAISSLLRVPILLLIGADAWQLALYETLMFPVVQFQHANIRLPEKLDRLIRVLFTTPAMHKVHHSDFYKETNSNYTSLLSVWDRVFGSFRVRSDLENIRLGLKEFRSDEEQTFLALLMNPLVTLKKKSKEPPSED